MRESKAIIEVVIVITIVEFFLILCLLDTFSITFYDEKIMSGHEAGRWLLKKRLYPSFRCYRSKL
jgi:hypothetical protein